MLDLSDIDTAIAEPETGSSTRTLCLLPTHAERDPPGGVSPPPVSDPLWSAATSLRMVAVGHVGNTKAAFAGGANIGWDEPGAAGSAELARLASPSDHAVAENLIVAPSVAGCSLVTQAHGG